MNKDLRSVIDRGLLAIGRGVLRLVQEHPGVELVQAEVLKDEVIDQAEHLQAYGFASHPIPGAEVVVLANAGSRNHPLVVVIADRRHRPALEAGEMIIHDDQGQFIKIARDQITVHTDKLVRVEATRVEVASDTVEITATETARIAAQTVEIHAADHVRIDAGGAGVTYWPSHTDDWRKGLPTNDIPPAPPEHMP